MQKSEMGVTGEANTQRQSKARRRGSMRPLSATLDKATGGLFRRRGFSESGLARDWSVIVGPEMAARCLPRGLRFERKGERRDGTLTLRVAPGFALHLQHLTPLLIERTNAYFGYRAIARLVINQGPLPRRRDSGAGAATQADDAPLDPALARRLDGVEDEALRGALERLGRSLRSRQRS